MDYKTWEEFYWAHNGKTLCLGQAAWEYKEKQIVELCEDIAREENYCESEEK